MRLASGSTRALTVTFIAFVTVSLVIYLWREISRGWKILDVHYAAHEVADMIGLFAMQHKGRPPETWDELITVFEIVDTGYGRGKVTDLETRIHVDFAALQMISHAGFRDANIPLVVTPRESAYASTDHIRQINKQLICNLRRLAESETQRDRREQ